MAVNRSIQPTAEQIDQMRDLLAAVAINPLRPSNYELYGAAEAVFPPAVFGLESFYNLPVTDLVSAVPEVAEQLRPFFISDPGTNLQHNAVARYAAAPEPLMSPMGPEEKKIPARFAELGLRLVPSVFREGLDPSLIADARNGGEEALRFLIAILEGTRGSTIADREQAKTLLEEVLMGGGQEKVADTSSLTQLPIALLADLYEYSKAGQYPAVADSASYVRGRVELFLRLARAQDGRVHTETLEMAVQVLERVVYNQLSKDKKAPYSRALFTLGVLSGDTRNPTLQAQARAALVRLREGLPAEFATLDRNLEARVQIEALGDWAEEFSTRGDRALNEGERAAEVKRVLGLIQTSAAEAPAGFVAPTEETVVVNLNVDTRDMRVTTDMLDALRAAGFSEETVRTLSLLGADVRGEIRYRTLPYEASTQGPVTDLTELFDSLESEMGRELTPIEILAAYLSVAELRREGFWTEARLVAVANREGAAQAQNIRATIDSLDAPEIARRLDVARTTFEAAQVTTAANETVRPGLFDRPKGTEERGRRDVKIAEICIEFAKAK